MGHSDDWYNVHINMLYNELCEIRDTLFVFEEVEKECAISDIRISSSKAMQNIAIIEVDKGIDLIGNLYKECYGKELEKPHNNVTIEDIIQTFFWM